MNFMKRTYSRIARVGTVMVLSGLAGFAQGHDVRPAYEAATIKLNSSASQNRGVQEDKAQVVFTSVPLKNLVQWAYKAYPFQISGPAWLEDIYVDIFAKYPPDLKDEQRPLMLRTLLEDRLKLTVHRESKEMQGYALVIAKGGFQLKPVEPGPPVTPSLGSIDPGLQLQGGFQRTTLLAKKSSIASLANLVTRIWDQMVVDKTGLTGVYDFELRWTNDDHNPVPSDDPFPALSDSIQETLGLRLQPEKVPAEMIVVDHVERVPIEIDVAAERAAGLYYPVSSAPETGIVPKAMLSFHYPVGSGPRHSPLPCFFYSSRCSRVLRFPNRRPASAVSARSITPIR